MTMVRSITSQPVSFSRLRACERGDFVVHEEGVDAAGRRVGGAMQRLLEGAGRGFHVDEFADFLALAGAEVGRGVEAGALLGEGGDDGETQRLGQVAQLGQRGFELDVVDLRQLHGGHDGRAGRFLAVGLHAGRAACGRGRRIVTVNPSGRQRTEAGYSSYCRRSRFSPWRKASASP
jgi:hypothetical protein